MQGTRQRHPSLKDERPPPRTERTTTELTAEPTEQEERQQETGQATQGRSVYAELYDLLLLAAILVGFVALAGAML